VARGSETISARWVEGAKRECVTCGVKITNLDKQVGEVRSRYPGPVREIICMDCHLGRKAPQENP
jgi:hypothetical protein